MDALDAVLRTYPSWSHLVIRLALGIVFFAHGSQKVLGWFGGPGLRATINGFKGMGVLIAMALSILIGGAGVLSIDRAIWLGLAGGE
jgi:putative oxidoreductase